MLAQKLSTVFLIALLSFLIAMLVAQVRTEGENTFTQVTSDIAVDGLRANAQSSAVTAAPATEWNRTYGEGNSQDHAYSTVQTNDGGYAIAGSTGSVYSDYWLVKTDSFGNMQWNKTYGDAGVDDFAYSVVQTKDGGYALAGYKGVGGFESFWLVKTDSSGNKQWSKIYNLYDRSRAYSVVQTEDGGYALAGYAGPSAVKGYDLWLVKTDADGNAQWNMSYGGTNDDFAYSVVQTNDGGYAIAGEIQSGPTPTDFWLIKTDSFGFKQWDKTYGGAAYETAKSVVQTSDGGYAVAGFTTSFGSGSSDFWLVKTNSSGDKIWDETYGGAAHDYPHYVIQTDDGGYAVVGETFSSGAGMGDCWLVRTDVNGAVKWTQTYGGTSEDCGESVVQTSEGGYALAGFTTSFGAGFSADFWLIKIARSVDQLTVSVAPTSPTVAVGQSVTLTATPSGGTTPYNYQWYENTTLLSGKTSSTLSTSKSAAGSYTFFCKVTDSGEQTANSNNVTLTVTLPPSPLPLEGYIIIGVVVAAVAAVIIYKLLKRPKKLPTPVKLRIIAEPLSIIADGNSKSTITLQLLDKKGQPIPAITDTQVRISAAKGKLENPLVTIPKGKDTEKTVIVSSEQSGQVPVVANAEGLKSISITLNFEERKRYCMHCGSMLAARARTCQNCGKAPPAGVDTKVCVHCESVIPVIAKFCSECGAGQPR